MLIGEQDCGARIEGDCAIACLCCDLARAQHPHPGSGVNSDRFDVGEGHAASGPKDCSVGQGVLFGACRDGSPDLVCEVGQGGGVSSSWRIAGHRGSDLGELSLWELAQDERVFW